MSDLPKISAPAQRALAAAGVRNLEDLTNYTELEIAAWHGIGPNVLGTIKEALAKNNQSFKQTA